MGRIRKQRITWTHSNSSPGTSYKLYWAVQGSVDYHSEYMEVGRRTEVILPDDIPSLLHHDGPIEIGVTAVNALGNESDMEKLSAHFRFAAPPAPQHLAVDPIRNPAVGYSEPMARAAPASRFVMIMTAILILALIVFILLQGTWIKEIQEKLFDLVEALKSLNQEMGNLLRKVPGEV